MKYVMATILVLFAGVAVLGILFLPLPGSKARTAAGVRHELQREGRIITFFVRGNGPRVVLAASVGREVSDFNELTGALVDAGYRTVAVEAPGINGTDLSDRDFDLFDLSDDIKAVVDSDAETSGDPVSVLLGHAFGNRAARATAAKYPGAVRGIILIAAGGKRPVPEQASIALRNCFDPRRTARQRQQDIRYGFFASDNDIPDYWRRGWHLKTALLQGKATATTPSEDWWAAGGTAPMLVVQAESDAIALKEDTADLLKEEFGSRVQVALIADAGHALLPEQPEEIARVIVAFLSDLSQ